MNEQTQEHQGFVAGHKSEHSVSVCKLLISLNVLRFAAYAGSRTTCSQEEPAGVTFSHEKPSYIRHPRPLDHYPGCRGPNTERERQQKQKPEAKRRSLAFVENICRHGSEVHNMEVRFMAHTCHLPSHRTEVKLAEIG